MIMQLIIFLYFVKVYPSVFLQFSVVFYVFVYRVVLYKNRYLHNDNFENIYITDQFTELDRKRSRQGKAAALPLSHRETLTYIRPCKCVHVSVSRQMAWSEWSEEGRKEGMFIDIQISETELRGSKMWRRTLN